MANRMTREVERLAQWELRLGAVRASNEEEGSRLNEGWKNLKVAREDFRKEHDRKSAAQARRREDLMKREKFARAAERASYAAAEKAKKDVPSPADQRERFTQASEDTALTLNKILLVLGLGLELTPEQATSINGAIDSIYTGGKRG